MELPRFCREIISAMKLQLPCSSLFGLPKHSLQFQLIVEVGQKNNNEIRYVGTDCIRYTRTEMTTEESTLTL